MAQSINILAAFESISEYWSPKVIGRVNDQYVKAAKLRGEFLWHKHDGEDELFQVVKGSLRIQFQDRPDVIVHAGSFCVVPRATMHNPVAEQECWIMLIEPVTTRHTGDVVSERTRSIEDQIGTCPGEQAT